MPPPLVVDFGGALDVADLGFQMPAASAEKSSRPKHSTLPDESDALVDRGCRVFLTGR